MTQGFKYFGHTIKSGFTGVVLKPYRGAKKGGAVGFVKGVGQGVVGLVAAPVSGTDPTRFYHTTMPDLSTLVVIIL